MRTRSTPVIPLDHNPRRALPRRLDRPIRGAILLGLGFFLLIAAWAVSTPIGSTDEPSHIVKAVATVRGEFHGRLVPVTRQQIGFPSQWEVPPVMSEYRVPLGFRQPLLPCFFDLTQSPACAQPLPSSWKPVWALSYVGSFNPTYYAIVGWPSLFLTGDVGVYAMRLCAAAVNAALLGFAGFCLLRSGRGRAGVLALCVAATPMTLFAGSIINPSGMEICAAILAWCAALSLFTAERPGRRDVSVLLIPLTLGLALLSEVRLLGPLWVAVILVAALMVSTKQARAALRRDRRVRGAGAVLLFAIGTALWWSLTAPLELFSLQDSHNDFLAAVRMVADTIPIYLQQMVFLYGWAEAAAPTLSMILVFATLTVLVVPTLSARRYGRLMLLLLIGMVVLPLAVQGYEMHDLGVQWQGRYQLPYAVGIPLVAAYAMRLPKPTARWTSAAVVIVQGGCLWWTIRRNADLGGLWGSLSHWQTIWLRPSPPAGRCRSRRAWQAWRYWQPAEHWIREPSPTPTPTAAPEGAAHGWLAQAKPRPSSHGSRQRTFPSQPSAARASAWIPRAASRLGPSSTAAARPHPRYLRPVLQVPVDKDVAVGHVNQTAGSKPEWRDGRLTRDRVTSGIRRCAGWSGGRPRCRIRWANGARASAWRCGGRCRARCRRRAVRSRCSGCATSRRSPGLTACRATRTRPCRRSRRPRSRGPRTRPCRRCSPRPRSCRTR